MNPETYQNIVTMESSNWQAEQARKLRGFPLRALIVSLLLHALLLYALAPQFAQESDKVFPAPVLQGVLVPELALPSRAVVAPASSKPLAETVPPRLTRESAPVAAPAVPQQAAPPVSTPAAVPPLVPAVGSMVAPTLSQPLAPGKILGSTSGGGRDQAVRQTPGAAPTALVPESDERGLNAAGVRQFRLALAREARQFRRYPEAAQRTELTGTAEVRVTVESAGMVRRVDLSLSSGHGVLDKAALEMLRQAVSRVELPESLRGRNFAVLLPVVFEVEE